ncbi:MAG: Bro-N domain-containing protein [Candidatus Thermoplasmatota archaeon]|nr:Bro-N domain-containing protein [Euryarchaeota archaeon]MBU4031479.1 Bro-N domain-containing protein [Candidatus Thermoplasmatota archaeon]MBU4071294.1 Bro-N domain-containing protein [Candidatus Thermoplasmatota archaeon]MBU4144641.1 Bro-N domain-containing protein [Candidatus Thermoplasmatota archaeon]MBU4592471.1 Bro-N domain-containing protein [Candidatus Thermoplasmatota archaeon]
MDPKKALVVFQGKQIRRTWFNDEWWFSVIDIVEALTESQRPRKYWNDLKTKLLGEGFEVSEKIGQLKIQAEDGKLRATDCATTKNMFRIIQSIPSPKAEPFKQWLAQVGYERVEEIQNPEIAQDRVKQYYEMKGYPKEWIEKRLRGIAIRQNLTEEWGNRAIEKDLEYAILTNEITKATFGKTVKEYREFKSLGKPNQNLRDHMTDWELILTMIGEKATTDITITKDSEGLEECKESAAEGGTIAGNTRKEIEEKTGKNLVSDENYLQLDKTKKLKKGADESQKN